MREPHRVICVSVLAVWLTSLTACTESQNQNQSDPVSPEASPSQSRISASSGALDDVSAKTLFNERGCNACHETDEMRLGPPYRAVAARYSEDFKINPDARVAALGLKIRVGGAGAWGNVPMISHPAMSEAESERIARWILSLHQQP